MTILSSEQQRESMSSPLVERRTHIRVLADMRQEICPVSFLQKYR